ncbi:hypothetical protein BOX15_Mlig034048g1, partial [Macrostomum lignano]
SQFMTDLVHIGYSDLEFYELLGRGAKGSVYRARWISADRIVAVKKLLELDLSEAKILSQVKHKNVISFIGAVIERPHYCIVSELAELGCLFDYLHDSSQPLDFTGILAWAKQIASGMQYLHEEAPVSIIHRDLKSKNVVISSSRQCKICDFGSSKTVVVSDNHATLAGTPAWMAVELMLAERPATKHCDSWSYGVVLWELLTREVPFRGLEPMQIMYVVVQDGKRLPIPASCPTELASLMSSCWAAEPFDRPTCGEILKQLRKFDGDNSLQSATAEFLQQRRAWQEEIESALSRMQRLESQLIEAQLKNYLANQRTQPANNLRILRLEQFDVNSWREVDISHWLRHHTSSTGPDLPAGFLAVYADLLMQNNITGERFLRLSDYDLCQMGVSAPEHRASLLQLVRQLQLHNNNYRQYPPLSLTACSASESPAASPAAPRSAATPSTSSSFAAVQPSGAMSNSVVSAAAAAAFCPVRLTFVVNRLSQPDGSWKLCLEIEASEATLEQDSGASTVSVAIDSVAVLISWPVFNEFGSYTNSFANGNQLESDGEPMTGVGCSYMMTSWMAADSRDLPVTLRVCLQAYPPVLDIALTDWDVADDDCHRGGVSQLVTRQVQLRQVSRSSGLSGEDQQQPSGDPAGTDSFAATAPKIAHHVITSSSTPATPSVGSEYRPTFADMVKRAGGAAPAASAGSYRRCESSDYNYAYYNTSSSISSSSDNRYRRHPAAAASSGSASGPRARRLSDIVASGRGGRGGGSGGSSNKIRRSATNGFA